MDTISDMSYIVKPVVVSDSQSTCAHSISVQIAYMKTICRHPISFWISLNQLIYNQLDFFTFQKIRIQKLHDPSPS